jgi:predicted RNase H-like HicB family nuclease
MPTYLAIASPASKGFSATFPDFPGLEAQGDTLDALRVEAQGVIEEHLATAFEAASSLTPKTLDEIAPVQGGAVILALGAQMPKTKAVRINITIQEDLLQSVDRSAAAHNMSRSRFLAKAVEAVVTGRRHGGIQIPLSDAVLAAADKAAEAHKMNRTPFLAGIIEVALGLREGHGKGHSHGHCGHGKQ